MMIRSAPPSWAHFADRPGARAGADDHAAAGERRAQPGAGLVAGHRSSSSSLAAIASANAVVVDVAVQFDHLDVAPTVADRLEQRRVGLGVVERLALGVDQRDAAAAG